MMNSYHSYALQKISRERIRQERLRELGKFPFTCADVGLSSTQRLTILVEEVGEVAKLCQGEPNFVALIDEVTQVAAVATAWLEHLLEYHDSSTFVHPTGFACKIDETDQLDKRYLGDELGR